MGLILDRIPSSYRAWKRDLPQRPKEEQRFDRWLFINAAGVLLGEKTGELLSLDASELGLPDGAIAGLLESRAAEWGFQYRILFVNEISHKLLVYNRTRLQAVLDEAPCCIMQGRLGYASPLGAEEFADELSRRWNRTGQVPHEVGVALGYPLDDVFGFMGLLPLPCQGVCGWRVYGDMKESHRRSCAFNDARCRALAFIAA